MDNGNSNSPIRHVPAHLPTRAGGLGPSTGILHSNGDLFGEENSEVPLREYLRVLLKYRVIIVSSVVLATVLALFYSFTVTPRYTAESKIRISTYEPVLAATKIEDVLESKSKESNYLETQIEELKSFSLADRVLEDKGVSSYFKERLGKNSKSTYDAAVQGAQAVGYKAPIREIRSYLDSIEIRPVRRTSLVVIAATAEDPSVAALIAHRHASSYIDWVRSSRIEQQSRALQFLRVQADELREKVGDLEREMADYAEANSIVAVNKDENIIAQKMAQLNQLFTEITGKRLEAENMYKQALASLSGASAGFDDPSLQTMRAQLASLSAEYQELSAKFMPGYPKMVQLKSQIEGLKRTIEDQRKQIVTGLKAKSDALIEQEKNVKEELEQQKSRAFELSKKQVQYNSLNRDLTSSRELLESVLKQIKETGLSVESNSSNISIVDIPVTPQFPSFPRKRMMVMIGLAIGLAIGVGLAFVLDYIDNSIKTPEDVNSYLKLPSLGVVPSFDIEPVGDGGGRGKTKRKRQRVIAQGDPTSGDSSSGGSLAPLDSAAPDSAPLVRGEDDGVPVVFVKNPRSLAAEAYRTIRTGILLSQAGDPPRTILVTSAQSAEGKTTSSVNLAASLASSGARVVLMDADLRRPSLSKHFRLDSSLPGLVEILTGQMIFEDVVIKDLIKRISVVPAGKIPPNPAELLGSYEMLSFLERLAGEFDYVVIDSPPILPVTDSVVLSRYVDGVVLVVRGGTTPRKIVIDAKNRLIAIGARVLGTVLNDVDITGADYYYYNRYYSSYYQKDDEKRPPRDRAVV